MVDLYTIGYANKPVNDFIGLLKKNSINCIVDVRSMPYSKQYPEYNEGNIKKLLNENGILYMSFKNEFGARREEPEAYEKIKLYDQSIIDVVLFDNVYKIKSFLDGFERIKHGIDKNFKISFLCSEKHPYDCHRCIMVAEYFNKQGYEFLHIVDETHMINQKMVDDFIKENFYKDKARFERLNKDDLSILQHGGSLFESSVDPNIESWYDFFKEYTRDKGYYLRNLEIGYKKGYEENE